jgi:hypothetical protein
MNARLTIKVIQQGQAQTTHPIAPGAGQNGKALVLQAAKGTRYQITDALNERLYIWGSIQNMNPEDLTYGKIVSAINAYVS